MSFPLQRRQGLSFALLLSAASSLACSDASPGPKPERGALAEPGGPAPEASSAPRNADPTAAKPATAAQASQPSSSSPAGAAQAPTIPAAGVPAAHAPAAGVPDAPASSAAAQSAPAPAPTAQAQPAAGPSLERANAMAEAELRGRRDLWPERVAFTKEARLDATTGWRAGEELALFDWQGENVVLDEGTFLFEWPARDTDVVARTRAYAASLTPEALELTVDALRDRPELWPLRVQLTATLQFGGNVTVPAGREVTLRFFEGRDLAVWDREVANYYTLAANETDLMARARERLLLPAEEREPFFTRSLAAALDPGHSVPLQEVDYVLVYSARLGCPRCEHFRPELDAFYAKQRAAAKPGARFELVLLSSDPDAAAAQKYLDTAGFPGGAIAFDRRFEAASLMNVDQRTLPGLFVFDRAGMLVDRNHPDAGSPTASDVLARFATRIETGGTGG
jgi:hypothetical protein